MEIEGTRWTVTAERKVLPKWSEITGHFLALGHWSSLGTSWGSGLPRAEGLYLLGETETSKAFKISKGWRDGLQARGARMHGQISPQNVRFLVDKPFTGEHMFESMVCYITSCFNSDLHSVSWI